MFGALQISPPVPFATRIGTVTTAVKTLADFFTADEVNRANGVIIYASAAVFVDWSNNPTTAAGFPIGAAGVQYFATNARSFKVIATTGTVNLWIGLTR